MTKITRLLTLFVGIALSMGSTFAMKKNHGGLVDLDTHVYCVDYFGDEKGLSTVAVRLLKELERTVLARNKEQDKLSRHNVESISQTEDIPTEAMLRMKCEYINSIIHQLGGERCGCTVKLLKHGILRVKKKGTRGWGDPAAPIKSDVFNQGKRIDRREKHKGDFECWKYLEAIYRSVFKDNNA